MPGLDVYEVWSPLVQGGFAVFALILLVVNVWLVKQLLRVLKDNNSVIAGNSRAIEAVAAIAMETKQLMQEILDATINPKSATKADLYQLLDQLENYLNLAT